MPTLYQPLAASEDRNEGPVPDHHRMSSRERRDDIDGLRCVAVLAVVVFHYAPVWLPGGFVGVDVFFVISGYLISGIVAAQLESDSFSIVSFLARRFLRILPAAYFVIVACLYMSLKWYDGDALLSSTSATMAAVLNVSNEYFYQTVGYFNQNNLTKPLLHTWSLSVEMQFYFVFPLVMASLFRVTQRRGIIATMILIAATLGCTYSEYLVRTDTSAAYFRLSSRFWEIMLGSVIALYDGHRVCRAVFSETQLLIVKSMVGIAGISMIVLSSVFFSKETPFPGLSSTVPCLGTFAVLWSGSSATYSELSSGSSKSPPILTRFLSLPAIAFVGKVSFSVYLLHWPMLVFATQFLLRLLSVVELFYLFVAVAILSFCMYYAVEEPFRKLSVAQPDRVLMVAVLAMTIICFAAFFLASNEQNRMVMSFARSRSSGNTNSDFWIQRNSSSSSENGHDEEGEYIFIQDPNDLDSDCHTMYGRASSADGLGLCAIGSPFATDEYGARVVRRRLDLFNWGDSHAHMYLTALRESAAVSRKHGLHVSAPVCPPLLGISNSLAVKRNADCVSHNHEVLNAVLRIRPSTVILAARWTLYVKGVPDHTEVETLPMPILLDVEEGVVEANDALFKLGLFRMVKALVDGGIDRIVLVDPTPEFNVDLPNILTMAYRMNRDLQAWRLPTSEIETRHAFVSTCFSLLKQSYPSHVSIIHSRGALCDDTSCGYLYRKRLLYRDSDHLSSNGGRFVVGRAFQAVFAVDDLRRSV